MPFKLSRNGLNVIAEVQRWQYFLLRNGISQSGSLDGDFGIKTETGTKIFQVQAGIPATGKVNEATLAKAREFGYTILASNYYESRSSTTFPGEPAELTSPSNKTRNAKFGCFTFIQRPLNKRPDLEAINIRGNCAGSLTDWTASNIIEVSIPQLRFARGSNGKVRCHVLAAGAIINLFESWEKADLLHLVMSYEGCFVPRYKRNQAPSGTQGHGEKKSSDVAALSNHSFGSAFDINFLDNQLSKTPAVCGRRGSVRELAEIANTNGFFWGGHFSNLDGMHFEMS